MNTSSEAKRFWPWPGMIFVLLGANALGTGALIYFAHKNGTPAAEIDFYARGAENDQRVSDRTASERLGWNASATIEPGMLRVSLADAGGKPVKIDSAAAEVIHRSESGRWQRVTFDVTEPGVAVALFDGVHAGSYEVRFEAKCQGERFIKVLIVRAGRGGA